LQNWLTLECRGKFLGSTYPKATVRGFLCGATQIGQQIRECLCCKTPSPKRLAWISMTLKSECTTLLRASISRRSSNLLVCKLFARRSSICLTSLVRIAEPGREHFAV